jgi:hypothetical protein
MANSAPKTAPDAISELTQVGREIDELFNQQYDRLCFHNNDTENAYRRDEDRMSSLMVADGISAEKRKEFGNALIALADRYRESFVKSLLALDDEIGVRIAEFSIRVQRLTRNVPDDNNEAQVMVRRWLILSQELRAARAGGAKSVALRVDFDTTLPKKILKDNGSKDIPFTPEEGVAFQEAMAEFSALLKHSHEENERIEPERKKLAEALFVIPQEPQPPAPNPPPAPTIDPHPLEGKAWFRMVKIFYMALWIVAAGLCALLAYVGTDSSSVFWTGAISVVILIAAKKVFYYVTLGRTTAMEPAGSGFVDVGGMEDTFTTLRSNSPDLYQSVVEPYLTSWKRQYGRRIPRTAFNEFQERVNRELSDLGQKRQKLFDEATKAGKTLEISSLRERMEESKAVYEGADRAEFARGIDAWIFKLEATYGTSIPIDEAAKILDEFEAKNRAARA